MFRSKAFLYLMVGVVGGALVGGPVTVGAATSLGGCRMAESPLGKLLAGNVGRWLVLRSEANVTDAQKEQIRQTVLGHKAEIATVAKGVVQQRIALRDAVLEGSDEAAIRAAADNLGKAIGDAAVLGAKVAGEVKPILTEEQRKLVKQCMTDCDAAVGKFIQQAMQSQ